MDPWLWSWIVLPLLIFVARICDVSMGTIRVIFITRGYKYLAPAIGFFEVGIWLLAIREIMANLTVPLYFVAYAAGFAAGTFIGLYISERLTLGKVIMRVITRKDAKDLLAHLDERGLGYTAFDARGHNGKVKVLFMILDAEDVGTVTAEIKRFNPRAFYSIEDVRQVNEGIFPSHRHRIPFYGRMGK